MAPAFVYAGPILGPITGTFGLDGPGVLTFNASGSDFINFCASVSASTCISNGSGMGNFTVTGPGTNTFAVLTSSTDGTIDDITDTTPPAPGYTYLPIGVPVSIDNIVSLTGAAYSDWDFQADILPLAACTTTSTQECLGPFQLDQNGANVSVEMNIYGTLINKADGSISILDVAVTGNFVDTTIGAVIGAAVTPTGAFSDDWSATVTASAAPEPGTSSMMLLAGAGLVALSHFRRQRKS